MMYSQHQYLLQGGALSEELNLLLPNPDTNQNCQTI